MAPRKKPIVINKDYGRQPQMESGKDEPDNKGYLRGGGLPRTYRALISRETEFAASGRVQNKHSEFKRPYHSDEFPEMEHFYSPPIGDIRGGIGDTTGGWSSSTPPDSGVTECWDVCYKNFSGIYNDGTCFVTVWTHTALTIISSNVELIKQDTTVVIGGHVRSLYKSTEIVDNGFIVKWKVSQPQFEACPNISELAANQCNKSHTGIEYCPPCPVDPIMTWDDATSADTIAQSDSVTVAVQDGLGDYNWTVAGGQGFTLSNAVTSGTSNTLNTDATACGTAVITVTDECGTVVTGEVRCTTGQWDIITNCQSPSPFTCTWTDGGDRYTLWFLCANFGISPYYNPCNAPQIFGCEVAGFVDCADVTEGHTHICIYVGVGSCNDPVTNPNEYMYIDGYRVERWNCPP
jgi:hypothetical protein